VDEEIKAAINSIRDLHEERFSDPQYIRKLNNKRVKVAFAHEYTRQDGSKGAWKLTIVLEDDQELCVYAKDGGLIVGPNS
jgi:hypothetical protein